MEKLNAHCLLCETVVEVVNYGRLAEHVCRPTAKPLPKRTPNRDQKVAASMIAAARKFPLSHFFAALEADLKGRDDRKALEVWIDRLLGAVDGLEYRWQKPQTREALMRTSILDICLYGSIDVGVGFIAATDIYLSQHAATRRSDVRTVIERTVRENEISN